MTLLTNSWFSLAQSCDSVYKKLRYFRASVGNSSAIDKALESIVNGGFSFILSLTLLSIMNINPWPLLVSVTSLLVSVSFALGSSVSKYVEVSQLCWIHSVEMRAVCVYSLTCIVLFVSGCPLDCR